MTLYNIDLKGKFSPLWESAISNLIENEVLVPVEPCEHGNYAEHIVSVQGTGTAWRLLWAGVPTWCPGAGIGDTDGE